MGQAEPAAPVERKMKAEHDKDATTFALTGV